MSKNFLHGFRVIESEDGLQPIKTAKSGVIGLVGTAPDANEDTFPLNIPVLIAGSRKKARDLGKTGTLPQSIEAIFQQIGAVVVVIRVAEEDTAAGTLSNVIGSIDDDTGNETGILALLSAESTVKLKPRILIAPGFSCQKAVADQLISVANQIRGYAILDGPNTTNEDAISYREGFGSRRCEVVDPWFIVYDVEVDAQVIRPPSPYHAGVLAKVHNERGFWYSNSNQVILGIERLSRAITYSSDDETSTANLLNEKGVTTTIFFNGHKVFGNHTCSSEPKWQFKTSVITNDHIIDSLISTQSWAIDRNITGTFLQDIVSNFNNFLINLKTIGAIAGGEAWVDPERNTPDQIALGKVFINYKFTPYYPAEQITVESQMVTDYLTEIF